MRAVAAWSGPTSVMPHAVDSLCHTTNVDFPVADVHQMHAQSWHGAVCAYPACGRDDLSNGKHQADMLALHCTLGGSRMIQKVASIIFDALGACFASGCSCVLAVAVAVAVSLL